MRGRTIFKTSRPLLIAAAALLRLLPRGLAALGLAATRYVPTRLGVALRYVFLRRLARRCGDCVAIFEGVHLVGLGAAEFGDNVSIQPMCYIDATGGLRIDSDVSIAHATTIMTTDHDHRCPHALIREAPVIPGRVTIGRDVWIGAGTRILAGVSIGRHTVVGAGAVVTKDVPPDSLALGVPARVARSLAPAPRAHVVKTRAPG